jgi:hypothetical protein
MIAGCLNHFSQLDLYSVDKLLQSTQNGSCNKQCLIEIFLLSYIEFETCIAIRLPFL